MGCSIPWIKLKEHYLNNFLFVFDKENKYVKEQSKLSSHFFQVNLINLFPFPFRIRRLPETPQFLNVFKFSIQIFDVSILNCQEEKESKKRTIKRLDSQCVRFRTGSATSRFNSLNNVDVLWRADPGLRLLVNHSWSKNLGVALHWAWFGIVTRRGVLPATGVSRI